ncbi:hypothetical protein [Haloechinothrix halophila]|uniref:hypothetical protein n=1 Tax=Haloechinothrix halophila TaxID=1069073 RepID=UPI000685DB27|nr:hypothetical protein [Haloechinothrix halophila]
MGYTAQQIADMLQGGSGPTSYHDSSATSRDLVKDYKERQISFARLVGRLETAWVGESGDAARGAVKPLSDASEVSSENQNNVSMQMDTQGESFNTVKNTAGTGPGEKPESTFASDWAPILTDRDEEIENWNARAQEIVDAYNTYYNGTKQNAGVFPSSYGTLTGDPTAIDFNVSSSGGTGTGGGGTTGPSVGSPTASGGGGAWTAPSSGGTTAPTTGSPGSYGNTGTGPGSYASGGGTTSTGLPPGATRLPDGSVRMPDGSIHYPDGSIRYPDGRLRRPDGSIVMPDGTVIPPGHTSTAGLSGPGSGGYGGEFGPHGSGAVSGGAVAGGGFAGAGAGAGAAGGYGPGGPGGAGRTSGAAPFGPGGSGASQAAAGKAGAGFGPRGGMGGMMGGGAAGRGQGSGEDEEHKDRYYIKQEMDSGLEVEHDEQGEKLIDDQTGNLVVRPVIGE